MSNISPYSKVYILLIRKLVIPLRKPIFILQTLVNDLSASNIITQWEDRGQRGFAIVLAERLRSALLILARAAVVPVSVVKVDCVVARVTIGVVVCGLVALDGCVFVTEVGTHRSDRSVSIASPRVVGDEDAASPELQKRSKRSNLRDEIGVRGWNVLEQNVIGNGDDGGINVYMGHANGLKWNLWRWRVDLVGIRSTAVVKCGRGLHGVLLISQVTTSG